MRVDRHDVPHYRFESTPGGGFTPNVKLRTNAELVKKFSEWLVALRFSRNAREAYTRTALQFSAYLANHPIQGVTHFDVSLFLIEVMKRDLSVEGYNRRLYALRRFFDFLKMGGIVDSVAPRFISSRPLKRLPPRVLSESQVLKLIRCAKSLRDKAIIELLYATGCRVGELLRIRVEDLDFQRQCVRVALKGSGRTVFFGNHAREALRAYLGCRTIGPLFLSEYAQQKGHVSWNGKAWAGYFVDYSGGKVRARTRVIYLGPKISYEQAWNRFRQIVPPTKLLRPLKQQPISPPVVNRALQLAARRVGLGRITTHMIRHSYATHLLNNGADIRQIQELLGHVSLLTTQIYTKVAPTQLQAVYRRCHPRD
jgi:site-specific recombinase XerD